GCGALSGSTEPTGRRSRYGTRGTSPAPRRPPDCGPGGTSSRSAGRPSSARRPRQCAQRPAPRSSHASTSMPLNGMPPQGESGAQPPIHRTALLLALVVLDLGELGVDDVLVPGRLAAALGTGLAAALGGGRHGREQRLAGFLQRLGLGFDLGLVVALHRALDIGDRGFRAADHVTADLVAIVLDRAAGRMNERVGLVARLHQLLELPVLLAVRLG